MQLSCSAQTLIPKTVSTQSRHNPPPPLIWLQWSAPAAQEPPTQPPVAGLESSVFDLREKITAMQGSLKKASVRGR